jgi:nitrate reductase assembly molybdenum cofactor insertion protein NarJ
MDAGPAPFVLASALASYPQPGLSDALDALFEGSGAAVPAELRTLIREWTSPDRLEDLQSGYIALFDNGKEASPACETEYDRRRVAGKGAALSDIAGFYRAFGFELDPEREAREMPDHAGIELEFHALMRMKAIHLAEVGDLDGSEIVADGMAKFLAAHLGRFVGAIARRPAVAADAFYGPVYAWIGDLVAGECRRVGVEPVPADWVESGSGSEGETAGCAPGGACD